MTRDKALALFDALALRGYCCTLNVFHGVTVVESRHTTVNEPIYHVDFGPHDRGSDFALEDLHAVARIADEHQVKVQLFPADKGYGGRFFE